MALRSWHACILSGGVVAAACILSADEQAPAQAGAAHDHRWQVTVIERSTLQTAERVVRDAVLVDLGTGQTWIMTKAEGLDAEWVPVLRKQ